MTTAAVGQRVRPQDLQVFVSRLFAAAGLTSEDADIAADALVAAESREVRTHGVANLAPRYLAWIESGFANPTGRWRVTREAPALMNVDGEEGLGIVVAAKVMRAVIERARETGICLATVHNSRHLGMAGYHAMLALESDMIGVCMTSVRASMVPTFGREPRLGTNPIAVAAPTSTQIPFVFDAATTTVASNKLRLAMNAGEPVAPGLMVDADGSPVGDWRVPHEPFRLTPLGGTPEASSHKGYGLAAAVDILSSVLSQATFAGGLVRGKAAHCLIAINVDAALPVEDFKAGMDDFVRMLKTTPPAPGHDEVLVAGEREHRATERSYREGLVLPPATLVWIEENARRWNLQDAAEPILTASPH